MADRVQLVAVFVGMFVGVSCFGLVFGVAAVVVLASGVGVVFVFVV